MMEHIRNYRVPPAAVLFYNSNSKKIARFCVNLYDFIDTDYVQAFLETDSVQIQS